MENLINILEDRFNKNKKIHDNLIFENVKSLFNEKILESINYMEETGGEPDFIVYEGSILVVDTSKETPKGRINLCYDEKARLSRKKFAPESSVEKVLLENGLNLVDEKLYFYLQTLFHFDNKTSSWIKTTDDVRSNGGAIFGDYRYGRVFIYHNGADSYYSSRGFRAYIKL